MERHKVSQFVTAAAICLVALPVRAAEPTAPQAVDATPRAKSVTVFPVVLGSDKPSPSGMSKKTAEVVGLLLERAGMANIEIADAEFDPPEKSDLDKVAAALGETVRSKDLGTEYALYVHFLGTPGKGVDEIRLVVVDRQGKPVLTQRVDQQQLSAQGSGKAEKKVDLMLAAVATVDRLRGVWSLDDPRRAGAPQGKMAKLWDEASGLPPESERVRIQARMDAFKTKFKTAKVAVYPVAGGKQADVKAAGRLAELLAKDGFGHVEALDVDPRIQVKGNSNALKMTWDTAKAVQHFVRQTPPSVDYVIYVSCVGQYDSSGDYVVGGVQLVVCDRQGEWVLVEQRNSHHAQFQQINPRSIDDCCRLVGVAITERLR